MSYDEQYCLSQLEILEKTEEFMDYNDEKIAVLAKKALEIDENEYILEEFDLVSKIVDYYDKYKRLSNKQKYCCCRAIAEVEHFFNSRDMTFID